MKIAIPTNDGINISAHFGRCRQFLIFEAQDGQVRLIETRVNAGCHEHGSGSSDGAPNLAVTPDLWKRCGIARLYCAAESARAQRKRSRLVEYP